MAITLGTVTNSSKEIADQKPSKAISPATGKYVTLNGNRYQIRFFFFEDIKSGPYQHMSFNDFLKTKDLLNHPAKVTDRGYGPILYFKASKETNDEGIFYFLAIRAMPE